MTSAGRAIDVLLIEDDPGDEVITREAFEHNKIKNNLHVAHDGEEGLDFLYRRGKFENAPRPDLVLLDLNLPKYDGRQLLEQIKSDPDLSHIPVVVLTTSSAEEDILRSYQLHANAYVTKPVDLDQFMEAVRQIDEFFVQVVRLPPSLGPASNVMRTVVPSGEDVTSTPALTACMIGNPRPRVLGRLVGGCQTP
jgi:CheY-like chemotaxis protein